MKITRKTAERLMKKMRLDSEEVNVDEFYQGLKVELECESKVLGAGAIHNSVERIAVTVWANIKDDHSYYQKLKVMEG